MSASFSTRFDKWRGSTISALVLYPLWLVVAFVAAATIARGLFGALFPLLSHANGTVIVAVVGAVMYVVTLAIAVVLPRWLMHSPTTRAELGVRPWLTWRDIGLSILGFVVATILGLVLAVVAAQLWPGLDWSQVQTTGFEGAAGQADKILAFVTLVVVAPMAEELIFRGYLYGKLRTRGIAMPLAIVVTSLMFALAHGQVNVGINVFALSLVLCALREFTGSIWAGVLVHMIKNGVAFYFLFINPIVLPTIGK